MYWRELSALYKICDVPSSSHSKLNLMQHFHSTRVIVICTVFSITELARLCRGICFVKDGHHTDPRFWVRLHKVEKRKVHKRSVQVHDTTKPQPNSGGASNYPITTSVVSLSLVGACCAEFGCGRCGTRKSRTNTCPSEAVAKR